MASTPAKFRVGVIGCGNISEIYFETATKFPILDMVACADLFPEAAQARAKQFNIPRVLSVDELLADPDIDGVLNLTIPNVHAKVAMQALNAGKHVLSEKPLGITREEGEQVLALAEQKNLRVANAPDTFLGSGQQTARRVLDAGVIGKPLSATAFMMSRGPEAWHPNPAFYYDHGGGPMFDMGPYYLHAMFNLFGPIKRVSAMTGILIPERTVGSGKHAGEKITVVTPDHFTGSLEFDNGVIATMAMSFATAFSHLGGKLPLTVFGDQGTMRVPDPNTFDGDVLVRRDDGKAPFEGAEPIADGEHKDWYVAPVLHHTEYQRSAGLADLAHAIASNRPHRASHEIAFAALDAMQGFLDSGKTHGSPIDMRPGFSRPAAVPTDVAYGTFE